MMWYVQISADKYTKQGFPTYAKALQWFHSTKAKFIYWESTP
jgi:hypothetical protein